MIGEDLAGVDICCDVDVERKQRNMREQEGNTSNSCTLRSSSLEYTQCDAFANERNGITNSANLQSVDSADIVDSEGVEKVSAKRQARITSGEE